MTVAMKHGGAAVPDLALHRARVHLAEAAEALAAASRNPLVAPDDVAEAEARVSRAFERYGGLMLLSRR